MKITVHQAQLLAEIDQPLRERRRRPRIRTIQPACDQPCRLRNHQRRGIQLEPVQEHGDRVLDRLLNRRKMTLYVGANTPNVTFTDVIGERELRR